jgi:hypothetical protein
VYQKASQISHQRGLLKPQEQADFDAFVQRASECFSAQQAGDEELGEVPDDFLGMKHILCYHLAATLTESVSDPVMSELMTDPVLLPTSGKVLSPPSPLGF